jgi:hypothetical protein
VALQYRELVAQGEDLGVLVTVTHRQRPQHGEGVGDGQIGQANQHVHIIPASNARLADGSHTRPRPEPLQAV